MKPKKSISSWILRCFLIMLLLALLTSGLVNFIEARSSTIVDSREWAEACSEMLDHFMDGKGQELVLTDTEDEDYQQLRKEMRTICRSYRLGFLSIYFLDQENKTRNYICSVADDDELNEELLDSMCLTAVPYENLTIGEEKLLAGSDIIQRDLIDSRYGRAISWLFPRRDQKGNVEAFYDMSYAVSEENQLIMSQFLADIIPFALTLALGLLILLILMRRRVILPIRRLSDSIRKFTQDSRRKPEKVETPCEDEIREIADSYEKMTEDISTYINNIESLTREKLENNVQMEVARRIQYGLVPEETFLRGSGFRAWAMTQPARAVGGDFYDCFRQDENSVCAVMGDVSGKGVSAAIFMAFAKTMIREKLLAGVAPAAALTQANLELCAQNPEGLFATVFAAVLDPRTGDLCYACAGHNPPVLLGENPAYMEPDPGLALGLFEDADIQEAHLTLRPGEGILLYTDGVTEAVNPRREFFGTQRLLETVRKTEPGDAPGQALLRSVSGAVETFREGCEPFDDMAVLALLREEAGDERREMPAEPGSCDSPKREEAGEKEREIPVELSSFDLLKQDLLALAGNTPAARKGLLACDEALANIVNYSGAKSLRYSCAVRKGRIDVTLSDDGVSFDPTSAARNEKGFEGLDSGGMGLNLIRSAAEEMTWERRAGRNVLRLRFPL